MLNYKLLKNHGGIVLIGDHYTLKVLHEVVHDVNDRSPIIRNKESTFLGLAYDVRKAYEQQREIFKPQKFCEEEGVRYGVKIIWPVLLAQHRMLRESLAWIDSGKKHQAVTYALEWVIECALNEDLAENAGLVKSLWQRLDPAHPYLEEKIISRGAQFCAWSGSDRKKYFANLLDSLDPMYPSMFKIRAKNGNEGMLSPSSYDAWEGREWPDPKV